MDNVDSVSMGHSHLDIVFLRCIIIVVVLEIETKSSRLLSATISANVVSASRFMVLVLGVGVGCWCRGVCGGLLHIIIFIWYLGT